MILIALTSLLGGLLLIAGVPKLRDRRGMLAAVQGYRLLPPVLERAVARGLPWGEVLLGTLLILGVGPRVTGLLAAALFTVFAVALGINLLRGRRDLDCGCFAFAETGQAPRIGWPHVVRALALAAGGAGAVLLSNGLGATSVVEYLLGWSLAALVLSAIWAAVFAAKVIHPGRRPVDTHLARARDELVATAAIHP